MHAEPKQSFPAYDPTYLTSSVAGPVFSGDGTFRQLKAVRNRRTSAAHSGSPFCYAGYQMGIPLVTDVQLSFKLPFVIA